MKSWFSALVGKPAFMFALHVPFRSLPALSILMVLTFASCTDKPRKNLSIIRALNESLINSNKLLAASTEDVWTSLAMKRFDEGAAKIAEGAYSKTQLVRSISTNTYNYLEKIKTELVESVDAKYNVKAFFKQKERYIYDSLVNYKIRLLQIDPGINNVFKNSLIVFTSVLDTIANSNDEVVEHLFENTDAIAAIAMLNKLQNNIRFNENRIVIFCHQNMAIDHIIEDFRSFQVIVTQSSTIVEEGGDLEIIAGVGAFTSHIKPSITINTKPIQLNEARAAIYKLKAPSKPGKYYVPVKINYTDQNGRKQSIQKKIEYTVANIQKQ